MLRTIDDSLVYVFAYLIQATLIFGPIAAGMYAHYRLEKKANEPVDISFLTPDAKQAANRAQARWVARKMRRATIYGWVAFLASVASALFIATHWHKIGGAMLH